MNPSTEDRFDRNAGALAAEETLRMIATLPARGGLEDRVIVQIGHSWDALRLTVQLPDKCTPIRSLRVGFP